tara:strand:- start:19060 stop:19695 length:636 start_codon:yes stop_codon:yes gene_type:complete
MIEILMPYKLLIKLLMAGTFGFLIKYALQKTNQKWLSTYHHTLTFILLPIITCGITNSIKSNIALSLGLVGALSIVRFRNPVKNTFELVLYFALISLGIICTVDIIFAIQFEILVVTTIIAVYFIDRYFINKGKKIHQLSFDEGNQLYTLEVEANEKILSIENNPLLIQKIYIKDSNLFSYKMACSSKTEIISIEKELEKNSSIKRLETAY